MATSATVDCSVEIANWARWAVAHKSWFFYEEERPFPLYQPTAARPIADDCSASITLYYWLAGAPDPNGPAFNYSGFGNTGTLQIGQQITQAEARAADVVIYGPGYGVHGALVIDNNDGNPLTVSHGQPSEPAFVTVSNGQPEGTDGVVRFFRFNTTKPAPPTPPAPPSEDEMVVLTTDPNNKGTVVLDLSTGHYYGLSTPAVLAYYKACGVKTVAAPTKAVFAKFTQSGTI